MTCAWQAALIPMVRRSAIDRASCTGAVRANGCCDTDILTGGCISMSLDHNTALLRKITVFSELSAEQLRLLAFSAEDLSVRDGATIFEAGDRADGGYVIVEGIVRLVVPDLRRGRAAEACEYGPGTLLGGISLIVEGRRSKRAIARGDVSLFHVRRAPFIRILNEYPQLVRSLFSQHARHLAQTCRALEEAAAKLNAGDAYAAPD